MSMPHFLAGSSCLTGRLCCGSATGEGTPRKKLIVGTGEGGGPSEPPCSASTSPHLALAPRTQPLTPPSRSAHQEPHVVLEVEYTGLRKTALPMRPRVSVQDSALRSGNFSLRIDPVRSGDAGLYEAQVTYNTEVQSCQVELGIVTGRRRWKPRRTLILVPGSHRAGLVETRWFHNGRPVPTSKNFYSLHGALSILRPSMSDSGSWHCQLRYSDNVIVSATHDLQILGFDGPANPVVYAAAGSAAELPCTLSYLPSAFGISVVAAHWSHLAGGHLKDWVVSQNQSSRSFPLRLPAVGPGDAGRYSCAVPVGSKTMRRDVTLAVVTVTPSIPGPVSEGSHLLLICSVTHLQGHERFQWKHLSSDHRSQTGANLDIPQVSQKDVGIWECSVYGPEGRLGAVEYGLQITGTISCTSVTNPFFSSHSIALSFLLSVSPHPSPLWLLISHLSVILSQPSVPPAAPSSSLHPFSSLPLFVQS
uniref:Ig-like domain-containing protein n=1 Tax=Anser cygnoides TaxID=8845 RepID=A0A8B9DW47_ANSCY